MLRGRTNAQTDFVRIDCSPRLSIANLICGDTLEQQSCTWDAGEITSDCEAILDISQLRLKLL